MKIQFVVSLLCVAWILPTQAQLLVPTPVKKRTPASLQYLAENITPCLTATQMIIYAHRGLDGYPNNTIASFRAGYDAGADGAELDLQITKDDHILVAHDAIPNVGENRCWIPHGTPLEKRAIREMDWTEASTVRCGTKLFSDAVTEPMPEMSEVFSEFKDRKTALGNPAKLNIEVKFFPEQSQYYPPANEYAERILKVIRDGGWPKERMLIQSFNHDFLKLFKEKAPDLEVVPLDWDIRNSLKAATDLGSHLVTPSFAYLTPELVHELHQKNIKVVVWTPDTDAELKFVINAGVDGVITNRTDSFLRIRSELCQKQ